MLASDVDGVGAFPSTSELRLSLPTLLRAAGGSASLRIGDMTRADLLVVFDFGGGHGRRLSVTNRQLALAAARWPELTVLAQAEVADALRRRGRNVVDLERDLHERSQLLVGDRARTTKIAAAAATLMAAAGWTHAGVLAHPAHVGRCAAALNRHGVTPIIPDTADVRFDFDRSSTLWWTRSARAWRVRETAVLLHHTLLQLV